MRSLDPRRNLIRRTLIAAGLATIVAAGCKAPYVRIYREGVAANRNNVQQLKLGMSRAEVESAMGTGEVVNHANVKLTNPWRTEAYRACGRTSVEILYYITYGFQWRVWNEREGLTPVVIEDGRLVGWGWPFVERHMPSCPGDARAGTR